MRLYEGNSIPGFPSIDAFFFLLKPELDRLREPVSECLFSVASHLETLAQKIMEVVFKRFPDLIDPVNEMVMNFLQEKKQHATMLVDSIVDMELNYLFTNDYDYLSNYTSFIPKNTDKSKPVNSENVTL